MQNMSVQLYTISTTQKGQRLLICFKSDLSALLHHKVEAACKSLQPSSRAAQLSKTLRSLWPFRLYLYGAAGTREAGARRGSRHAELIRLESCPLGSHPSTHSAPAGGQGKAVIKIDEQKQREWGYFTSEEGDEKTERKTKRVLYFQRNIQLTVGLLCNKKKQKNKMNQDVGLKSNK